MQKYEMPAPGETIKHMIPDLRWPRFVQMQGNKIMLWCEVIIFGKESKETAMEFFTIGTGHPIPPETQYLGTVMDEPYVWHVFGKPARH